jgi:hypothetical protein
MSKMLFAVVSTHFETILIATLLGNAAFWIWFSDGGYALMSEIKYFYNGLDEGSSTSFWFFPFFIYVMT